jgi:glyoxylase-like metal-dependent hydrolase (beta-lactamase superfamily II)/ferredoxin
MARLAARRPENVEGDFYVDTTCIDCDTCRWMAPSVYRSAGDQSAVHHQPTSEAERLEALQALLSCPTASIGTVEKPADILAAQESFPIPVAENVYHCGYHAESSFGAASYLIVRPEGNVMVDSPRFAPPLVKRLEALGGVRTLYLTHRDDVADHRRWHEHFGCKRVLHTDEVGHSTRDVEIQITGEDAFALAPDLTILPVPGHTKGHTVLLYLERFLFSGDHLAWSDRLGHLIAFRGACWYSWSEQLRSMRRLAAYPFEWVLPGHGRRAHAERETMARSLARCIAWMEGASNDDGW